MLVVNEKPFDQKQIAKCSKDVLKGNVFKFAYVHIEISFITSFMKWHYYGVTMALLYFVQERPDCHILDEMKIYNLENSRTTARGTEKLLNVIKVNEILLYTSTIRCHLKHDLRMTAALQLIEYKQRKSLHGFLRKWKNSELR